MKRHTLSYPSILLALLTPFARATYIGADPPRSCPTCGCKCTGSPSTAAPSSGTSSNVSVSERNSTERVPIASVGSTLSLSAIYNSDNTPGDRPVPDVGFGYGWTHSYNLFLFSQAGVMFRYDGDGRVTKYALGPDGTFIAAPGYFETLTQSGGVFTITQKDQTKYTFAEISGTPFLVSGPVWRITSIVDRNGNSTTFTYTAGNLTSVTDTYGRSLTFTYNAQNHLSTVTDPLARVTTFTYDSTGHALAGITDPNGNRIQYTYNLFYQLTGKTDKARRTFTYNYATGTPGPPTAVKDSSGAARSTLSNSGLWATDPTQLALYLLRVYIAATTTNTDGRGNAWQYTYDANGYLTQIVAPDGATAKYAYDPATLQMASVTDADGNTTKYTYNSEGDLLSKTDALGNVTTYTYEPTFNMMTSMTDPRGRVTTYTIDPANGNKIKETDPLGQTQTWMYNTDGTVATYTDKDGHTTKYTYDAFGQVIKITDPLGYTTTMTYDADGNLTSRTDADGNTTSYQYDGMNRLIALTDATGHTDKTQYDGEGNRVQVTDRDGHVTQYQYDLRQRLITMTDALTHSETYTYDGDDNRITLTDRDSHTTNYGYDLQNRLISVQDALGHTSATAYDPVGNVISQTDANGHTTTFTYDALNRRITMTDALGEVTKYFYDGGTFTGPVRGITCNKCGATRGSSLVTEQIDANGTAGIHAGVIFYKYDALDRLIIKVQKTGCIGTGCPDTINPTTDAVTTYVYDPVGNRLNVTEPDCGAAVSPGCDSISTAYDADNRLVKQVNNAGDTTLWTYDGVGNVITITAPNLNVTTNTYNSLNRLITVTDSAGRVAGYSYDPVGNRTSSTDGDGNTTNYAYDAINRLLTMTDRLGKTTTNSYDPVGNLLAVTDRDGNSTGYAYDAINRRITMTDALGYVTSWHYDPVGNLITLTDADGHSTQYVYDAVNRPIQEIYADGGTRSFAYHDVGNLIQRMDEEGQGTHYAYSDLYFLLSRTYPSAINDSFTYDLSGRLLSALRDSWTDTFTYDGGDRVTKSVQNGRTIAYVYNIPGRTRTLTYPGGRSVTEHTDARTRMDYIDDAASPTPLVQYAYDAANNVLSRDYRNGTTSSFTYNANNWTTSITHKNPTPFAGFDYAYDNEGNKQYEQKTQDPTHSEAYKYDATYRLIDYRVGTLVGSTVPVPSTETQYNLDPVGNLCKTTDTCQFNSTNEETKVDACNILYSGDGNLDNDCNFSYVYDEENRLTSATRLSDHAVVGQYQYDALSRRVQKIADASGTPVITQYYYDDTRIVEEQSTSGATEATYVYGNYVDEVLNMNRGGETYYYHQNELWSVEAITNAAGAVAERYSYNAYGLPNTGSINSWGTPHSAIGNPWMFTGRQFDEETGLYYYRARHYDPVKARFLQRDPLGYVDALNLYEYGQDSPTNRSDAFGESVEKEYSRGAGYPPDEDFETARIKVKLVVDTSACPAPKTEEAKCMGNVKLKLEYESKMTVPNQKQAEDYAKKGADFFGLKFENTLVPFKLKDDKVTSGASIELGEIPCKGGEKQGTVWVIMKSFEGKPEDYLKSDAYRLRPLANRAVQQSFDFKVKIKCCGQIDNENLKGTNYAGSDETQKGAAGRISPLIDVSFGEKGYRQKPMDK
jgi:RHS repeat-associated protein